MMGFLNKLKRTIGTFLFPDLAVAVTAHEALKMLACTRGDTGGVVKRVNENRELMQWLLHEVPERMERNPWVEGWIKGNDAFFLSVVDMVGDEKINTSHNFIAWPT